jgi:hypothetical protein
MSAPPVPRPAPTALAEAAGVHQGDVAARAVGAVALASLALIHVEDLPDTFTASRLVGAQYIALIAVSVVIAAALLTRHASRRLWLAAGAVAGSAMLAYVLSRTTGIPGDHADIGNWRCSLGLAALTVESMILTLSAWAILSSVGSPQRTAHRNQRPTIVNDLRDGGRKPTPTSWTVESTGATHQLRLRSGQ